MREIKFRGRDEDGQWRYGFLSWCTDVLACINDGTDWEVSPETVGQYTGLKDHKGHEIYEGDIIRYKDENGRVYYENDCFGVAFYYDYATLLMVCEESEVIGNVHDNPELLK